MRATTFLFCTLFMILAIRGLSQSQIRVYGQLRAIMQQGDLSGKVSLDTLPITSTGIGLGVAEGLKGEVVIIGGKVLQSEIIDKKITTRQGVDLRASMLVYTNTARLRTTLTTPAISSMQDLDRAIGRVYDTIAQQQPLAFIIKTKAAKIRYHVIDWQPHTDHTPDNHRQFAMNSSCTDEDVTLIGFYSKNHKGIVTPHSTNIHVHVYCHASNVVGHVDAIDMPAGENIRIY